MYRYIFTSSLQRRKSHQICPYNFIFALYRKLKLVQIASNSKKSSLKCVCNNSENKTHKYCVQTTKFLLQSIRPISGFQEFCPRFNVKLNMQSLASIPQCQLQLRSKQNQCSINWKSPKLVSALNALRERLAQFFRRCEGNTTEDSLQRGKSLPTNSSLSNCNTDESLVELLRLRRRILIDRTILLFSWFEVQKERLESANSENNINDIRKIQDSLLKNMLKEREHINRLLKRHERKSESFLSESKEKPSGHYNTADIGNELTVQGVKEREHINRLLKRHERNSESFLSESKEKSSTLLSTADFGNELTIQGVNSTENWQYNALDYVLRRHILNQPLDGKGYYNSYLWMLKHRVRNGSALMALFPQGTDRSNMIWNHIEVEQQGEEKLSEIESENRCEEPEVKQLTETEHCVVTNPPKLAIIESIPIPIPIPDKLTKKVPSITDRMNEDVILELCEEHQKQDSLGRNPLLNEPQKLLSKRIESFAKRTARVNADQIEKLLIYELYNEDREWQNIFAITGEVLEALIDELIAQHIRDIIMCIMSR